MTEPCIHENTVEIDYVQGLTVWVLFNLKQHLKTIQLEFVQALFNILLQRSVYNILTNGSFVIKMRCLIISAREKNKENLSWDKSVPK